MNGIPVFYSYGGSFDLRVFILSEFDTNMKSWIIVFVISPHILNTNKHTWHGLQNHISIGPWFQLLSYFQECMIYLQITLYEFLPTFYVKKLLKDWKFGINSNETKQKIFYFSREATEIHLAMFHKTQPPRFESHNNNIYIDYFIHYYSLFAKLITTKSSRTNR